MMKKSAAQSIITKSADQLLYIFLTEKYISDPLIFGLADFSMQELATNSFEITGDDFFCLYEKVYRVSGSESEINLKVYFLNKQFFSNGIDLFECKISTCLLNFCKSPRKLKSINSIELLLDNSLDSGSLIINDFLDVRFQKSKFGSKKKFHLAGISTNFENTPSKSDGKSNTRFARNMKDAFPFQYVLKKFKKNAAIRDLAMCVMKNFPSSVYSADERQSN